MRHDALMEMSKTEIDEYAKVLGIDVTGKKTVAQKAEAIEARRERVAEVEALGLTLTIPAKRMRDKRVTDILAAPRMTDAEADRLAGLLLGEEQMARLTERATDEDGTVDVDALGLVLARILCSEELKNF